MLVRWQPLTKDSYLTTANPAFHAVFRTDDPIIQPWRAGVDQSEYPDPYGEPFQPKLRYRGLLASVSINLPPNALLSLANAAQHLDERTIFRCYTEARSGGYHTGELGHSFHWQFDLRNSSDFLSITDIDDYWPLENAFYGQSGQFGILCSQGNHAVIGSSSPRFLSDFYMGINTTPEREVKEVFRSIVNEQGEISLSDGTIPWIPRLLAHIFGG